MKKITALLLAALMLLSLAACGSEKEETGKYNIGIVQLVQHDALDAATNGFMDAVKEGLGEENVTFDLQNASGDSANCATIVNGFVSDDVDLILANATPALLAAVNGTQDIPILGTSITDYGDALKIENFNGTVGGNISGTSDQAPLDKQAEMLLELCPEAENVGILYCSAEPNSVFQADKVEEYLTDKGVNVTRYTFTDSNDVTSVTATACSEVDAIYIPTDNTAASSGEAIHNAASGSGVPIISGEANACKLFGVATLSIDYYKIGQEAGKMAVKILTGEADISEMPIGYDTDPVKMYNPVLCEELNITPPADYQAMDMG
ncbi:MAG: ABC transporter substrate-binding protein [Oscillospiraceae bacterium]|nr:ABC transporter substrate-binding protein [Oscillospiraceae bacterium]